MPLQNLYLQRAYGTSLRDKSPRRIVSLMQTCNMRKFVTWHTTTNPHGTGSWAVIDGLLHVRTCNGTKIAELGAHPPETLARILMGEMARDELADA